MDTHDTDTHIWNMNEEKNQLITKLFWDFESDLVYQTLTERSYIKSEAINLRTQKL